MQFQLGKALNLVAWGPYPFFAVDPQFPAVPIDPRRFQEFMALNRQPLVRRLLFAIHFLCCRTGGLHVATSEQELSKLAWGPRRPHHWRRFLILSIQRATTTANAVLKAESGQTILNYSLDEQSRRYVISVHPTFLGSLQKLISNGKLTLINRNPNPDAKVSKQDLMLLRERGWDLDGEGKQNSDAMLRAIVRDRRISAASISTLSTLALNRKQGGGYRTVLIPALLGERRVCNELGPMVNLLADNRTRQKHVTESMIPAASGTERIVCPLLDRAKTYTAFAGNHGGRGYRLATWAAMLGTNERGMLKKIAAAKDRLGLVVVGVDRQNKFYDFDALAKGNVATWEKIIVRVYTPSDYHQRWSVALGWFPWVDKNQSSKAQAAPMARPIETDRIILRERVMEAGLRATANKVGVAPSHLSDFLKHGRGLAPEAVARVRQHILSVQPLGGPKAASQFAGLTAESPLLEWALAYRSLGWSIVPLRPGSRASYLERWKPLQTSLPTETQIREWWTIWPEAAIGLVLGPISGVFVIDCDSPEALELLKRRLGRIPGKCPMVLSGSRLPHKIHLYFRQPPCRAGATCQPWKNEAAGLEFRSTNGLVILPPSLHRSSGKRYAWAAGSAIWERPLAVVPAVILKALREYHAQRLPEVTTVIEITGDGGFANNFSTWNGRRVPREVAEFLRGEHARKPEWNNKIFRCARWFREHCILQATAEAFIAKGADPSNERERTKALRTIRSAYDFTGISAKPVEFHFSDH